MLKFLAQAAPPEGDINKPLEEMESLLSKILEEPIDALPVHEGSVDDDEEC